MDINNRTQIQHTQMQAGRWQKKEIPKNQREIQKQAEVQTKEALGTQAGI